MFSRRFTLLNRERFEKARSQKIALSLFFNLMKVFHDGIIIKDKDEIIYNNKQVENILDINIQANDPSSQIINKLKQVYPRKHQI